MRKAEIEALLGNNEDDDTTATLAETNSVDHIATLLHEYISPALYYERGGQLETREKKPICT